MIGAFQNYKTHGIQKRQNKEFRFATDVKRFAVSDMVQNVDAGSENLMCFNQDFI